MSKQSNRQAAGSEQSAGSIDPADAKQHRVTTVDLLRHGQCQGGEIFRGSSDVELTELGWQQMRAAVAGVSEGGVLPWQQLVSSPLRRCRQFAESLVADSATVLPLAIDERLREIHFGDWEGRPQLEIQQNNGELLQRFWHDPVNATPPNGEPVSDFRDRLVVSLEQQLRSYSGQHILLVAHGAVIRVLMCHLLNMPLTSISNIAVPYAGLTRFRLYETEGQKPWVQLCLHRGEG